MTDCHRLGRFRLSHLLLHRNARLPWLILLPEVSNGVSELYELEPVDRRALAEEIDVVACHPGDPCWPGVVWGNVAEGPDWPGQRISEIAGAIAGLRPFKRS